ncbi:MAG: hypothetical protein LBC69_02755 [Eubacteriaceae bacterium]|jgi:hypothetical protein|nr:hypothetical protein [Eubacteriaceae bacterium]
MHFSKVSQNRGKPIKVQAASFLKRVSAVRAVMMESALLEPELLAAGGAPLEAVKGQIESQGEKH